MKIKICFILYGAYPIFNSKIRETFGGAEVDLYNLAVKLAEDPGYEVFFIVGDYGQNSVEYYKDVKVIKLRYMNHKKYNKKIHKFLRMFEFFKMLLTTKADDFITETASELIGWLTLICGNIRRKRVIFRLASDINTDLKYYYEKYGKRFYTLYKYGLRNSDLIISQSEKQKVELRERTGLDSKIVKNGFFIDGRIKAEKKFILWVSRAIPIKRPELFTELAKRLPEEQFVIIMPPDTAGSYSYDGSKKLAEKILDIIESLDNVKYINYVPFEEIQSYYDKAKVFVNTSLYEGFPNSFIQACLARTPILSLKVNPDNFINKYKLGFVAEESIDNAVKFIRNLNEDGMQKMGKNALKYIRESHDINIIASEFKQLLESLK